MVGAEQAVSAGLGVLDPRQVAWALSICQRSPRLRTASLVTSLYRHAGVLWPVGGRPVTRWMISACGTCRRVARRMTLACSIDGPRNGSRDRGHLSLPARRHQGDLRHIVQPNRMTLGCRGRASSPVSAISRRSDRILPVITRSCRLDRDGSSRRMDRLHQWK